MTRSRRQFYPAWEDLGPTALPGPRDLNAIDHAVVNGVAEIEVTGLRDVTTLRGSVTRLGIERVGSRPGPRLRREGPAPGPSRLTLRMFWGMAVLWGRRRMSGLLLPLIIIMEDVSVDKEKSESSYMSRHDVQLSPVVPQAPEKRTITVIPSPPRPAGMDEMTRLLPEDPGLQSDVPGLQLGVPEGWTSPEIQLVPGLPLEDRPLQNLHPGMLHQLISRQLLTQRRKWWTSRY